MGVNILRSDASEEEGGGRFVRAWRAISGYSDLPRVRGLGKSESTEERE